MRIVRDDGYRNCQADVLALLKEDIRCRQRALTKAVRERRLDRQHGEGQIQKCEIDLLKGYVKKLVADVHLNASKWVPLSGQMRGFSPEPGNEVRLQIGARKHRGL